MGTSNYSDEFNRDAVHQITVRGYLVRQSSRRLGDNLLFLCVFFCPKPQCRLTE
jgi:transposase